MKLYSLLETNANIPFLTSALRSTVHDRVSSISTYVLMGVLPLLRAKDFSSSKINSKYKPVCKTGFSHVFEHYSVPRTAFWNWPEMLSVEIVLF